MRGPNDDADDGEGDTPDVMRVQIAKLHECHVIAICGGAVKAAFVKARGADRVIDATGLVVAALGTGRVVEYVIVHRSLNEWEVGVGTIASGTPNTLTRERVKASSNAGSLVTFSSGTKDVFIAPHANRPTGTVAAFLAATL